jgi:hypothetical protein
MVTFSDKNLLKTCHKFHCKYCDYKTSKKSSYSEHLLTLKHKKYTNGDVSDAKPAQNLLFEKKYACDKCDKIYLSRNGLWVHKKKCKQNNKNNEFNEFNEKIDNIDLSNKDDLIMILLKQNSELLEIVKNGTNNTTNTNTNCNNHSHNKTFNLQLFLNETCKDAMNITDFIDSIKLQLSDLEKVGEIGYIEGISNIITKNLKALDITQRPIHCTDKKRDVLYVKDENKWEKEDEEKKQMRKLIKNVSNKNIGLIPEWKKQNPDCIKYNSKKSDICNQIIIESMGGKGDNNKEKEDKIIKNISKNVIIDKEICE